MIVRSQLTTTWTYLTAYSAVARVVEARRRMVRSLVWVKCVEHYTPLREVDRGVFEEVEQENLMYTNQQCHFVVYDICLRR